MTVFEPRGTLDAVESGIADKVTGESSGTDDVRLPLRY